MRRFLVDQLSRVILSHSPGRILVLVPTRQIGRNLSRSLLASGVAYANVEFDTALGTAKRLLELDTSSTLPTFAQRDDSLLAAAAAVEAARKDPEFYFGAHVGHGFVGSAERTLRALDDVGASPGRVKSLSAKRGASLASLLDAFREARTLTGRLSDSEVFESARQLAWPSREYYSALCILDEVAINASGERFVKSIAAAARYRIGIDTYEHDPPSRSALLVLPDWRRVDGGPDNQSEAASMRIATAFAPESEVSNALADMVAAGLPWDTCELVYTRSTYLPIIEAVADALDIPVRFAEGRPALGTNGGQLLAGFLRWIAGGLRVADVEALLRTRSVQFSGKQLGLDKSVQPYAVAELLRTRRRLDGREAYVYLSSATSDADRQPWERDAAHALTALVGLVPASGRIRIGDLASRSIELLERFASDPAETTVMASLIERLRGIGGADLGMPLESAASLLLSMVADHRYGTSVAEGGHLYVVPLVAAGYAGRDNTYVVGLDEHTFPGSSSEDPLLLDDDRAALSPALPLVRRQPGARLFAFERMLALAGERVVLYSRGLDLIYGKRIELSPSVEALRERYNYNVDEMPLVEAPERAMTMTGRLLGQRRASDYGAITGELFQPLQNGHEARAMRLDPSLNKYAGFLGIETPELSLRDGQPVSASRLETLATCPYRYFLRYVLRIRPPDDSDVEPGQWLNARELGTLLHLLYYRFMLELHQKGERVDYEQHESRLMQLLDEIVADQQEVMPPPGLAALEADLARMRRAARVFLREESAAPTTAQPAGFEVRFGRNADEEPLPVSLADDLVLGLSGSIDRVNRVGDGYEIWDYKTGSMRPFEGQDLRETSQHLQWMLYAYVYETLRQREGEDARVKRSGYLFANDREFGRRLAAMVPGRNELAADLRPLMSMVERGAFPHYHKSSRKTRDDKPGEACTYCDFADACWRERRSIPDIDDLDVFDRESDVGRELVTWLTS